MQVEAVVPGQQWSHEGRGVGVLQHEDAPGRRKDSNVTGTELRFRLPVTNTGAPVPVFQNLS